MLSNNLLYCACDDLSMLGLKLNHVIKSIRVTFDQSIGHQWNSMPTCDMQLRIHARQITVVGTQALILDRGEG